MYSTQNRESTLKKKKRKRRRGLRQTDRKAHTDKYIQIKKKKQRCGLNTGAPAWPRPAPQPKVSGSD